MTFCPNKSLPEWKELEKSQPNRAYYLWNKYKGEVPTKYYYPKEKDRREKAAAYLSKLFPGKETIFYDFAKEIGNKTQHGYIENGAINMWTSAEVGTEYHEAYHLLFRTMLSEEQRQSLYKDAAKEFGKPTAEEVEKIKKEVKALYDVSIGDEEASNLVLEEKMADGFMDHMLTEEESSRGIIASIAKWFRDLFSWIKGLISNKIGLRDLYSLMETTKVNDTFMDRGVFRNPEAMQSTYNPSRLVEGIPSVIVDQMVDGLTNMVIDEIDNWETPIVSEIIGSKNKRGKVVNGLLYQVYKYKDNRNMDPRTDVPVMMKTLALEVSAEIANKKYNALRKSSPKEAAAYKPEVDAALKAFVEYRDSKGLILNNFRKPDPTASPKDKATINKINNRRKYIKHVIINWNGKKDSATENTIVPSWRNMVIDELRANQYNIVKETIVVTNEEGNKEDEKFEGNDSGADVTEIYGKSHFEDSPLTKVAEKAKRILRRIPKVEASFDEETQNIVYKKVTNNVFTSEQEYWPLRYIYKQLSELWADVGTFQEMEEKLIEYSKYRPDYASINQRIMSMPGNERALLYKTFAQTLAEFKMAILGSQGKILSANSSTTEKKAITQWTSQIVEIEGQEEGDSRAVFSKTITNEETGESTFKVRDDRFQKIADALKKTEAFHKRRFKEGEDIDAVFKKKKPVIDSPAWALGSLIWELGFNLGSNVNKLDTIQNVQNLINAGFKISKNEAGKVKNEPVDGREAFVAIYERGRLLQMVKAIANLANNEKGEFVPTGQKEKVVLYHNTEKQGMNFLAGLVPLFSSRVAESFVTPVGSQVYPVNMATTLSELKTIIKKDVTANKEKSFSIYRGDHFMFPPSMMPSHLFFHLTENEDFLKEFSTDPLAGIRDFSEDALDYEDFNSVDSILTRLQMYDNNMNERYYFVAVPAQADRARFDMMLMPRINGHFNTDFNKQNGYSDVFRDAILQDLLRIKQARVTIAASKEDPNVTLIPDYHTGKMRGLSDEFMQFDGIYDSGERIITDRIITSGVGTMKMSDLAEEFVKKLKSGDKVTLSPELREFREELSSMIADLSVFYTKQSQKMAMLIEGSNRKKDVNSKLLKKWAEDFNVDISKGGTDANGNSPFVQAMTNLLKDFLIHEDLGRNEIVKLTRGNRALFKTLEDFTKRQKLLTTPRTKLAEKNTLAKKGGRGNYVPWMDEPYGAISEYNELVFDDPMGQLTTGITTQLNDWVEKTRDMLLRSGYTLQETEFLEDYRPGKFEEYDGLTLISIDWLREIMQGEGEWLEYHEIAYKNYKEDPEGKFVYPNISKGLPRGAKPGQDIPIKPYKPFGQEMKKIGNVAAVDLTKTAYFPLLKSYTKAFPAMDNLRMRMEANPFEANNPYAGMQKIHTASAVSAKKGVKLNVLNIKNWSNTPQGFFSNVKTNRNSTSSLGFPQSVPGAKEFSEAIIGRQVKKNAIANVKPGELYYYNAGLSSEVSVSGSNMTALYHAAIEEKIKRDLEKVNKQIGLSQFRNVVEKLKSENTANGRIKVDAIKGAQEFKDAKAKLLKNIRNLIEEQAIEREMSDNFIKALDISIDPITGIARFAIPMDFPVYGTAFQSALLSVYNNQVFKQYASGYEAVQTAAIGGFSTDRTLEFTKIVPHASNKVRGTRLAHAEIMVREDVLRKFGIEPGEDLDANNIPEELRRIIGYRIPNQDKASTIIFKIKAVLPAGYEKSIVVPPQLVKLMGSDFDVDKMFLLFPELDESGAKIKPDYETLSRLKNVSSASDKELLNIMLDTIEAVFSSPEHYLETLKPLDNNVLEDIRNDLVKMNNNLAPGKLFTGGMYETNSAVRNLLGNRMRGLWANALAGRNIATVSDNFNLRPEFAVKIERERINTKMLKQTPKTENLLKENGVSPNDGYKYDQGQPTDKILSRYLNAAVDSTNAPYHYIVNDNTVTFPVELIWALYYGDTELLHFFLNQPIIRDFVDMMDNIHNNDLSKVNQTYGAIAAKYGITLGSEDLPKNYKDIPNTTAMKREAIMKLAVPETRALQNFLKMYTAGSQLKEAFKVLTPDTMSGINRLEAIQAQIERKEKFDNPRNGKMNKAPIAFYGRGKDENVLTQFFDENSIYGFERGYNELLIDMAGVASILFPMTTSEATIKFKEAIKYATNLETMTVEQHRDVNAAIMFTMLTRKDSPLSIYMDVEYSDRLYKPGYIDPATIDPRTKKGKPALTLWTRIEKALVEYNLSGNEFLAKLTQDENAKYKNFKTFNFDATQQFSREEKSRIQDDLYNLLYKPEAYLGFKPKEPEALKKYNADVEKIRQLGFDLCMHTLISNGFRKSAYNYVSMIPPQLWLSPMPRAGVAFDMDANGKPLKPISVADYMHEQSMKMQSSNYFNGTDLARFFRIYGEIRPGGSNLAERHTFLPSVTKLAKKHTIDTTKYGGNQKAPGIMVFRTSKGESGIYVKADPIKLGNKSVYLDMFGTTNNKKHIVGGDFLKKKTAGDQGDIENILSTLQAYYELASFKVAPSDVTQICML